MVCGGVGRWPWVMTGTMTLEIAAGDPVKLVVWFYDTISARL